MSACWFLRGKKPTSKNIRQWRPPIGRIFYTTQKAIDEQTVETSNKLIDTLFIYVLYLFYIISIQLNCQETFMWGSSVSFSTATETCAAKFSFPSALGYFLRLGRQDGNGIWLRMICDEARCRWGHETTVYHIYPAFWCNCLILFAYLHSYQLVISQPSTDIYMGTSPKHGNVTRKNMQKYECIQWCLQTQRWTTYLGGQYKWV